MSEFRATAQTQLDTLLREPGVRGVLLVSRDGLSLLAAGHVKGVDMIAAMSAAMLGAAEIAMADPAPVRLCAEADKNRLIIVPAAQDTILILLGDPAIPTEVQLALATAAGDAIAAVTTRTIIPQGPHTNWLRETPRESTRAR